MLYQIRQVNPLGGTTGCFGRRDAACSAGEATLVCPLCAHEIGDTTTKTARLSASKYIQCESCGRSSAVYAENGAVLVPGVVAHALLTGLPHGLPASRHALILDGLPGEGLEPASEGDFSDIKAALQGDGNLVELTQVGEAAADRTGDRRVVHIGFGDAARRLANLAHQAGNETLDVPPDIARLLETV